MAHILQVACMWLWAIDSVQLFLLGSISRGVQFKEWEIPSPQVAIENYDFYPGTEIIAPA